MTTYFSTFYPVESAEGAKGSAAFLGSISTALVYLYKRSATALVDADKPNGNVIYTFATGNENITAVTNGWTVNIPSGTDPLYVVAATATGINPTDTIAATEWSSPVVLAQNGLAGINTATVFLFKRQTTNTLPAIPTQTATYTFASGALLGVSSLNNTVAPYLDGWSQTAPDSSGGKYLFVTTATAISSVATDTILTTEWATVQILAENGTNAVSALLTNETFTTTSLNNGTGYTLTNSGGTFKVFSGTTDVTTSAAFSVSGSATLNGLTIAIVAGTGVYSLSGASWTSDSETFTLQAIYSGTTITKTYKISKVKTGAEAVTAYATNEAQSLFAYADGNVASFLNANGLFKIYSGSTDVTASADNFTATASGCTGTINTPTNTAVNGQPIGYYQINTMSADTATLTLSARYPATTGTTYTKIYTLSKTKTGYESVATNPSTNLFVGRVVYNTTDKKLYYYNGSAWVAKNGSASTINTVVDTVDAGAITAAQMNVTQLSAITATIGVLRTTLTDSGARTEIRDNVIKVYDSTSTSATTGLRVKIGNLAL